MDERSPVDPLLERAFELAPAHIAVHRGPDHVFVFANRAFRDASDGRQMLGRPYADVFPEFVEQGYLEIFDRIRATGEPFVGRSVRADTARTTGGPRAERYWDVSFQALRDGEGRIDGLLTCSFEVTAHVRARREAERAREEYEALVDTLGIVAFRVDPDGWRPAWVRGPVDAVFGVSAETLLDPAAWDAVAPGDLPALRTARSSLRRPGDRYRAEYRRGDRWLAENGQLRTDGVWGIVQDVTERITHDRERERLREQLLHLQRSESLGLLAGGIAHDFNNLLTSILGNASLAELQLRPGDAAGRSVTAIATAARRASDLTRQLLAFSGKSALRKDAVDVNTQVRELAMLFEASIPKTVSIRLDLAPSLPLVDGDGPQIGQVIMNLVLNGAEAIQGTGAVVVRTSVQVLGPDDVLGEAVPGAYVRIEVSDTGRGMDPEAINRIFDAFYTTKPGGRGLGLAAVQGIVRGHGGFVQVQSQLGRGTTFRVNLPARVQPTIAPAEPSAPDRGTVLVVDDEPGIRQVARAALEMTGYHVVEAADGVEAVETFRAIAAEIVVVLMDLTMPRMGGADALVELRRIDPNTPVLLTSGYLESEATRRLVSLGVTDFLQKPYGVRELIRAVERSAVSRGP